MSYSRVPVVSRPSRGHVTSCEVFSKVSAAAAFKTNKTGSIEDPGLIPACSNSASVARTSSRCRARFFVVTKPFCRQCSNVASLFRHVTSRLLGSIHHARRENKRNSILLWNAWFQYYTGDSRFWELFTTYKKPDALQTIYCWLYYRSGTGLYICDMSAPHSLLSLSSSQFHKQLKTHLFLHSYPP